jgi:hypothetical protein
MPASAWRRSATTLAGFFRRGDNPAFLAVACVPAQHQQRLAPLLRLITFELSEGRLELQLN